MFPAQILQTDPGEALRCQDSRQLTMEGQKGHNENAKADAALANKVHLALWKDAAFRAIDHDHIDVRVDDGMVHLYGHASSLTNQHRAENAIRNVDGVLGIKTHLIPDDRLLTAVASALGRLERAHDCKFFIGVSHGVVLLSGNVADPTVKLLAEKCAASVPNVRGVISTIRTREAELGLQDERFLQPSIGETIYFLDGISGVVRQVVINPGNKRVIAMSLQGKFLDARNNPNLPTTGKSLEQLITVSMKTVRYLTKDSGFLHVRSDERNQYLDFDPSMYTLPNKDWVPPYPYCPEDILFPVEDAGKDIQIVYGPQQFQFAEKPKGTSLKKQFFSNDSCGG